MPGTKKKTVHAMGATAKIQWVPNENAGKYISGAMAEASDTVILRFSAALEPKEAGPIIQATSWKFLRDGMNSGNALANEVDQVPGNWNWMSVDYSTHLTWGPKGDAVLADPVNTHFKVVTEEIKQVGLLDLASYTSKGTKVDKVFFPWKLNFRPNSAVKSDAYPYEKGFENTWINNLEKIPANAPLFDVYAVTEPS